MRLHCLRSASCVFMVSLGTSVVLGGQHSTGTIRPVLPRGFIENRGQWPDQVKFGVGSRGMLAAFERHAIALLLTDGVSWRPQSAPVRLTFEGASGTVVVEGETPERGAYNFFLGNDKARWRRGVRSYGSVVYRGLYDGIDVRVRGAAQDGSTRNLEYDLNLEAGADLAHVVVRCDGAGCLAVASDGSLLAETPLGTLRQPAPTTWQVTPSGQKRFVACRYRVLDDRRFGFEAPEADPDLSLVIDPELMWGTYLGGAGYDGPSCIALGKKGTVAVGGFTFSASFDWACMDPPPAGVSNRGVIDVFVAIYDGTDGSLLNAAFLGGGSVEGAFAVAVGDDGSVFVAGQTASDDFPSHENAFQPQHHGEGDGFLAKLNPALDTIEYSTFFGGSHEEGFTDLAIDPAGAIVLCGYTASANNDTRPFFVTPGAFQDTYGGPDGKFDGKFDACVVRIDPRLPPSQQVLYSTYLGGSELDTVIRVDDPSDPELRLQRQALALDGAGRVMLTGSTWSANFPGVPQNAPLGGYHGGGDVYLTVLTPDPSIRPPRNQLHAGAFLGGSGEDHVFDIELDARGNATVVGRTDSQDIPVRNALQAQRRGPRDAFALQVSGDVSTIEYATYFGGESVEAFNGLHVMDCGDLILGGVTESPDFPATDGCAVDDIVGPEEAPSDAFLLRLDPSEPPERQLIHSALCFNGSHRETLVSGPVGDGSGTVFFMAATLSSDCASTPGACDAAFNGIGDAFIGRYSFFFSRGNANGDPKINIADAIRLLEYLFGKPAFLPCPDAADANDDDCLNIADAVAILGHLFGRAGPLPERAPGDCHPPLVCP